MKTETAKQAAELLAKIEKTEKKIEHLSKIRKNINISIKGVNEDLSR